MANEFVVRREMKLLSAESAGTAVIAALGIDANLVVMSREAAELGLSGISGYSGASGTSGVRGAAGAVGSVLDGTHSSRWQYDSAHTPTPSPAAFSMDTDTFSGVGTIWIHETSNLITGGGWLTNGLVSWINANPGKLLMQITDVDSDKAYGLYSITGASSAGLVYSFTVGSVISSSGSAADQNDCVISFIMEGSSGASGVAPSVATVNYYQNIPWFNNTTTLNVAQSTSAAAPFFLPANATFNYMRLMGMFTAPGTSALATTANINISAQYASSWYAVIYSRDSANSLRSVASASALFRTTHSVSAGATGSRWTMWRSYDYPVTGSTSRYNPAALSQTSTAITIGSASLTMYTGTKFIDIPFAASLSEGNYWIVVGRATGSSTNATNATGLTRLYVSASVYGVSQLNIAPSAMGIAPAGSLNMLVGQGIYTTNSTGSRSAVALSQISSSTSNNLISFQLIKNAGAIKSGDIK